MCRARETVVQRGNTVRLTVVFKDWGGDPIDPDTVKVIIYDRQWVKIHEAEMMPSNRTGVGQYYYYFVPDRNGTLYYEWQGRIDGMPSLHRAALTVREI